MTIATDKSTYSFAEYLQLEETAAYKNEYQDGEIVPITGGTTPLAYALPPPCIRLASSLYTPLIMIYIAGDKLYQLNVSVIFLLISLAAVKKFANV